MSLMTVLYLENTICFTTRTDNHEHLMGTSFRMSRAMIPTSTSFQFTFFEWLIEVFRVSSVLPHLIFSQ